MNSKEIYIKVLKDGPYLVYGTPPMSRQTLVSDNDNTCIKYAPNKTFEIQTDPVSLCRCGKSRNAPFCDGSHTIEGFDGEETASFEPILDGAIKYEGPNLTLADNEAFCASARFCDAHGGIWNLVYSGTQESDAETIREASLCPAGRLMIFNKNGVMVEDDFNKSIALLEDEGLKISGPIWVRGGIRVESADGQSYEVRNRQTLCRCGCSKNKPFCDSAHRHVEFKADYKN